MYRYVCIDIYVPRVRTSAHARITSRPWLHPRRLQGTRPPPPTRTSPQHVFCRVPQAERRLSQTLRNPEC